MNKRQRKKHNKKFGMKSYTKANFWDWVNHNVPEVDLTFMNYRIGSTNIHMIRKVKERDTA